MTTRTQRIELITRGERRRWWSIEEKREIVAESLRPGVKPSEIIHRHGITSGQLYAWRQQLTRRVGGELPRPGDQAQPVERRAAAAGVEAAERERGTEARYRGVAG